MASSGILNGVVALVFSLSDGCVDPRSALEAKVVALGATIRSRFSKQVTHIMFHRRPQASPEQIREEDDHLRKLQTQASKVLRSELG